LNDSLGHALLASNAQKRDLKPRRIGSKYNEINVTENIKSKNLLAKHK